jgi:hypothetical protein
VLMLNSIPCRLLQNSLRLPRIEIRADAGEHST